MSLTADILLERLKLKNALRRWRGFGILAVAVLLIVLVSDNVKLPGKSYIARLSVENIIEIDHDRSQAIDDLIDDKSVKAVIISIDSPGGTAAGGESLYYSLKKLQAKKPVVVVMNNMATSAGYLIAMPAHRIFAHKASLTGSIGVIMQVPNVSGLAEKVGVKMQIVKTGALKGAPSMFEDMDAKTEAVMMGLVNDFYNVFVDIITEHRNLEREEVVKLSDGRVYSGLQAVKNGLIDEIGTEEQAVLWLEENKDIKKKLDIFDVEYGIKENPLKELLQSYTGDSILPKQLSISGLLAIYNN